MTNLKYITGFVVIILICLLILGGCLNGEKKDIAEWVKARSEQVIEIEFRLVEIGPYWYVKNARHYYVKTDQNVYWVKYMFGRTINQEVDGKYVKLE